MAAVAESGLRNVPVRALGYMGTAVGLLALLDAGVKWLTADYAVPQIVFVRYTFGLLLAVILASASPRGLPSLKTRRLPGHLLRSVLNLATMLTFYYALRELPLADTIAITYAAPLFMCGLSVVLLRERVGPRRWTAIVVGFVGVLIIVQPSGEGLRFAALLALASALLYALTLVTSRQLSSTEESHTILFYYSAACLITMGAFMPFQWKTPTPTDWWIFLLVAVAGSFGQFCLNQAFRFGEVSLLAPVEYTNLLWGVALGFVVFGDVPTWTMLGGAAIVIASSLYIVERETKLARARARATLSEPPTPPG